MVFDTMIISYAFLNVEGFSQKALACVRKASRIYAPELLKSELLNVLWQYVSHEKCGFDDALFVLDASDKLIEWIPVETLREYALRMAIDKGHSPYDMLFTAAALIKKDKLLTNDKRLIKAYPQLCVTMDQYIKSSSGTS